MVEQQLGQRRLRPAPTGQLAIQRDEAAGDSVFRPCQPISLPKQGVMEQFGERSFHSWGGKPSPPKQKARAGNGQTGGLMLSNDRSIVNYQREYIADKRKQRFRWDSANE